MSSNADKEQLYCKNRQEFREWLASNHDISEGIWLVFAKTNSELTSITYDEAVDEALCFGWIDSLARGLDEDWHMRIFTPRRLKSLWSKVNKKRIERLIQEGIMTEHGLQKIERAKKDGSWTIYDAVEDLIVPDDLQQALDEKPKAKENFEAFPPSSKKNILWWIISAKRQSTRDKRIAETVTLAEENIRANH